jgi:hypothetical protein
VCWQPPRLQRNKAKRDEKKGATTDDVLEISGEAVQADVGLHVARLHDHHLHIVCV